MLFLRKFWVLTLHNLRGHDVSKPTFQFVIITTTLGVILNTTKSVNAATFTALNEEGLRRAMARLYMAPEAVA